MPDKESTNLLTSKITSNLFKMLESDKFDYKWSVVKLVFNTFSWDIFWIVVLGALIEFITITNVFITSFFVDWIKDENAEAWLGYFYASLISLLLIVVLLLRNRYFFNGKATGINIK